MPVAGDQGVAIAVELVTWKVAELVFLNLLIAALVLGVVAVLDYVDGRRRQLEELLDAEDEPFEEEDLNP